MTVDKWETDFQCPASEWDWLVRFFYVLGTDAEVYEPETLRHEIVTMARQTVRQYERGNETEVERSDKQ